MAKHSKGWSIRSEVPLLFHNMHPFGSETQLDAHPFHAYIDSWQQVFKAAVVISVYGLFRLNVRSLYLLAGCLK